jgi:mannosyltransferase
MSNTETVTQERRKLNITAAVDLIGPRLLPLLFIGLAFVLRAVNITGESLWRDEVDTIRFALAPLSDLLGNLSRNGFNGPLYLLIMRIWLSMGGVNDFNLRFFSLVCGVVEVALIFVLARRLVGRRAGLVAMWFAAVAPVLIWYSGEGKMYTLQPALLVLALYAFRCAVDQQAGRGSWKWWSVFVVAVSAGYYVHLLTPIFIVVAILFFLAGWPTARRHLTGAAIAAILCTLPYVPLARWQLSLLFQGTATGHQFFNLDAIFFTLFLNWSLGLNDQWPVAISRKIEWLAIFSFLAIAAVAVIDAVRTHLSARATADNWLLRAQDSVSRSIAGLLGWLLVPALVIYLISTRSPIFEPRYVLWSAPALYILVGYGLAWLQPRLPFVSKVALVGLSLICVAGFGAQVLVPIRPDIRGAARLVATDLQADDALIFQIPYTRYGFEYYLPQLLPQQPLETGPLPNDGLRTSEGLRSRIVEAPYTNGGAMVDDVSAELLTVADTATRVWFVESESALWDQRGMVRSWLDDHMTVIQRIELHGVIVTLYKKP